ncbi:DNA polymerase [Desulfurococcus amylolyticus 1221n]|uniref:DNA polymerase n=1 Tax=Desulfurococcus amylolyticus (strain DSM 18924 / JCM 16383 / VKM B-2413 / 1221n) TaxID=490899 RepID=B8D690_DESA1|nr:DNA polymerase II [Desulfurococcus amylolyticus]ACL11621.1 DNA polymerase [Desulfurococcus amylolyticus 1221n]
MEIEFYLLDVTYEVVGKEPHVILWGITRNGERVVLRDRRFRPYFYAIINERIDAETVARKIRAFSEAESPIIEVKPTEKKYFGKPVKALRITTVIPEYVRKYRERIREISEVVDVLEADIRFSMRYLLDHGLEPCGWHIAEVMEAPVPAKYRATRFYEVVSSIKPIGDTRPPKDLRVMAFDIEVYSETGTPHPERDPVIIIGGKTSSGEVKQFIAEELSDKDVIAEFTDYILRYDPDIIVGYNSSRFDWPYLMERARVNNLKLDVGRRRDGQPSQSTYGHISIPGRIHVDLLNFAEEIPEVKLKSLDIVADYLGVMKRSERVLIDYIEFPRYWRDPARKPLLLRYNLDDVESTMGLAEKFLPFAMQLSSITGLPLDQVGAASVGNRLEWFLMREAFRRDELIPNRIEKEVEPYKGAVVLQPLPGIHENIAVLDFTSMYPNIMIKYNIGPDTIIREGVCRESEHYVAPEVKHCFLREPPGFFKGVLQILLSLRKQIRGEMKKYKTDSPEYRLLDERQKAIKVLANATYGYMGWVAARWYCKECAEAVTAWGRRTILSVIDYARVIGLKVIYGDTDSLFVENIPDKITRLSEYVERELGFEIKIDKVYKRVFFTEAKKRYAGLLEDGRVDIVGFEAVRGDWAEIAKEVQEKVTEILLSEKNIEKAIEYVRNIIAELNQGRIPLEKLIIWKTLTKSVEEYEAEAPHVNAARKMKRMGMKIEVGDKIGYIVVKGSGKISDRAEPYMFVKDPKLVDTIYYIDHQIIPAALRILEYFGVTDTQLKKVASTAGRKSLFDYTKKT